MFESIAIIQTSTPQIVYTRNVSEYRNVYTSFEKIEIEKVINEVKKLSDYEIENYDFEKIDDEIIALGIKFKDFPQNQNKTAYAVELMDKLDDKLPENIDIWVV